MKTLRPFILVLLLSVASFVFATAQGLAQQPELQMQSTSVIKGSGSTLPQAAHTGAVVAGDRPGMYSPTDGPRNGHLRREDNNGDGWEDDDDPDNPGEPNPLGDAGWPLALLAIGYAIYSFARKRT